MPIEFYSKMLYCKTGFNVFVLGAVQWYSTVVLLYIALYIALEGGGLTGRYSFVCGFFVYLISEKPLYK